MSARRAPRPPVETVIDIRVLPSASRSQLAGTWNGYPRIRLAAPPVEGAANRELVLFLARLLGLAPSSIEIVSGHSSRLKRVRIVGAAPDEVHAALYNTGGSG